MPLAASILSALNSDDEETMDEKASSLSMLTKKKKKAKRLVLSDDEDDDTKGQLILKCLFGVFNPSKKRTKTSLIVVVKLNSFVRFLEETSA